MGSFKVATRERKVQPAAAPAAGISVQTSAADFGGIEAGLIKDIGRGVQQVGEIAQRREEVEERERVVLEKEQEKKRLAHQEKVDKLRANEAVVQFQDELRGLRPVHRSRTGSQAIGITNTAIKDIEKLRKQFGDVLVNDRQKELFAARIAKEREVYADQTSRYELDETNRAEQENIDARINNAIIDAANFADDPLARFSKRLDLDIALIDKTQGMDGDQAKNVKAEAVSAYQEGVVNQLVMADPVLAKEYYENHKDEIVPESREGIEDTIEKLLIEDESEQTANTIIAQDDNFINQKEAVNKLPDKTDYEKEVKKAAREKIDVSQKQLKQLDKEKRDEVLFNTRERIIGAKDLTEALKAVNTLNPKGVNLSRADIDGLKQFAHKRHDIKNKAKDTDPNTYGKAWDMFHKGELQNENQLLAFWPDLSNTHFDQLASAIRNKSAKERGAKVASIDYSTAMRAYSSIKRERYDVENEEHNKEFVFVQDLLEQASREKGDSLSLTESLSLVRKNIVEGEAIIAGGLDPDISFFEATQTGQEAIWLPFVNDDDKDNGKERRDIKEAFKKKGIITDDDELFRMYKKEAILDKPLSPEQKERFNRKIRAIGILRPVKR